MELGREALDSVLLALRSLLSIDTSNMKDVEPVADGEADSTSQNAARLTLNTGYSLGFNHLRGFQKLVAIMLAQVYATPLKEPLIKM